MKTTWSENFILDDLDISWNTYPDTSGVYIIMRDGPVARIGGVDEKSIIYIGKSINIRDRLWDFLYGKHTASDFLWTHPAMTKMVLKKQIRNKRDVEVSLGLLKARYSAPIDELLLDEAERALIFTYIECYGEAPPLNLNLPKRWNQLPSVRHRRWAEQGLF